MQLVDTRRSERRALTGVGVQLSPWSLQAGQVPDSLPYGGEPGSLPGSATCENLTPVGQRPAKPHTLRQPGATPGPATDGRVRKLEKRPGREPGEFVGSTPTSANFGPVVQRHDTSPTCWGRWFNSIRDHCWFFGLWRYSSYKKISRLSSKEPVTARASHWRGQEFFS